MTLFCATPQRLACQVLFASLLLLSACGGGGGGDASNAPATPPASPAPPPPAMLAHAPVTAAASPLPGTTGVRVSLQDGTSVFALGPEDQDTARITVSAASLPAGADTAQMVGRTLLQFANLPEGKPVAVVRGVGEIQRVYECDAATRTCARLPSVMALSGGDIAFPVLAGKFYAVQKR